MKMMLSEIAKAIGVPFDGNENNDVLITEVCFDSRKISDNALFIPLIGARDGHDFVQTAIDNGAKATLFMNDHTPVTSDFPTLMVDDTLHALQQLAGYYLRKVNPKVVAVTGSNGKTTTKDMIAATLGKRYNIHATAGNFNNEIGVPITILGMKMNTEIIVLEMGMDRPGQLEFLSKMVEPDVAVITMIGEAHIEFFGTREKIAEAKMEITSSLKEDGKLIYNGDEPLLRTLSADLEQETRTFGFDKTDDLVAHDLQSTATTTTFLVNDEDEEFSIPLIGQHNVANALAAILVGRNFHESYAEIQAGLHNFALTKNRMEWYVGAEGEKILSDIYNSNPTALKASLQSFVKVPRTSEQKRIIVLADMLELGDKAPELHAQIAQVINPAEIDQVFLYGSLMENLAEVLLTKFDAQKVHHFAKDQQKALIELLQNTIQPNDFVFLKGSNSMHLDQVLAALM